MSNYTQYPGYGGAPHTPANGNTYPTGATYIAPTASPLIQNQYAPLPQQQQQQQQNPQTPNNFQFQPNVRSSSVVSNIGGGNVVMTTTSALPATPSIGVEKTFDEGVDHEQIPQRDIFNVTGFDIAQRPNIECMMDAKESYRSRIDVVSAVAVLATAVTTIMVLLTNFKRNADPDVVESFGADWDRITNFIIYAPLVFFVIIFLVINNYYSERIFYEYLLRGIIVDFPQSGEFMYILKHIPTVLFLLVWLAYYLVCIAVLFKGQASAGIIFAFTSQMVVGVAKSWYNQQSIESRFVSLSDFIMCFPQRNMRGKSMEERKAARVEAVMDECNLKHVSYWLKQTALNFSESPSWSGAMRQFKWRDQRYSGCEKFLAYLAIVLFVGGIIGACVAGFVLGAQQDIANTWGQLINPCVQTCANVTSITSRNFSATVCDSCLCSCLQGYHKLDVAYTSKCSDFFQLPNTCSSVASKNQMCGVLDQCSTFF